MQKHRESDDNYEIPETAQIDELQTFIGSKKNKIWVWTVFNSKMPGILKFVIGDRWAATFTVLWQMIHGWACFLSCYRWLQGVSLLNR